MAKKKVTTRTKPTLLDKLFELLRKTIAEKCDTIYLTYQLKPEHCFILEQGSSNEYITTFRVHDFPGLSGLICQMQVKIQANPEKSPFQVIDTHPVAGSYTRWVFHWHPRLNNDTDKRHKLRQFKRRIKMPS
jgi:hypothetical protein